MTTTRHEFLEMLHTQLQPRGYLEIGVLFGDSLRLAKCPGIGIDPEPRLRYHLPSKAIFPMTSDRFFLSMTDPWERDPGFDLATADRILDVDSLDLAFIDGMHLYEFALRDYLNVERYANPRTVVVFDDVLPRNQHEAAREQCPGDWTGDVWKVPKLLEMYRRDLKVYWVNTQPTGTAVVFGIGDNPDRDVFERIGKLGLESWEQVPEDVINRDMAVEPGWALEQIALYLRSLEELDV